MQSTFPQNSSRISKTHTFNIEASWTFVFSLSTRRILTSSNLLVQLSKDEKRDEKNINRDNQEDINQ